MTERVEVAIVGGGITGLGLAFELMGRGVPHVVLEARDRPGGVMRSERVDGHLLEWGPQRTRMTAGFRDLVTRLGIADEVITAPPGLPLFVYRAGRLRVVPFSPLTFLTSNVVPFSAKARLFLEPLTRGPDPEESVADFFVRKVGRAIYENLVGPLYGGLYASDPADMVVGLSVGHVLAEFGIRRSLLLPLLRRGGSIDPPAAVSFRNGMATLPRALAEANRPNVRLGTAVRAIHRIQEGWRIDWEDGQVDARKIVLTTPAPVTADLLAPHAPRAAEALRSLVYNPLAVVHLHATTDLRGLGFQVSFAESLATRGVTFNDSLFGRDGVYTAYLGGAKRPEVVRMTDGEVGELARREFRQVTGFDAQVLHVDREWMPAWDRSWAALRGLEWPSGIDIAANWESRPGIPGRLAQAKRLAGELAPSA